MLKVVVMSSLPEEGAEISRAVEEVREAASPMQVLVSVVGKVAALQMVRADLEGELVLAGERELWMDRVVGAWLRVRELGGSLSVEDWEDFWSGGLKRVRSARMKNTWK